MRIVACLAYVAAAGLWFGSHPSPAVVSVILLFWLLAITRFEQKLTVNEGPWNHPEALRLSFTVLPTMAIGLSLFAPMYASWALLP